MSFGHDRQRALIQMATGSGKTYTTVSAIARLLAHGNPRRVLFLVDRKNLGEQAEAEFRRYRLPWNGRLFTEVWNVQLLQSSTILESSKVVITTIQRLYSALRGEEDLPADAEEGSQFVTGGPALKEPVPVAYSPRLPPESFDVIFVDE